jgi:hypothetical protein
MMPPAHRLRSSSPRGSRRVRPGSWIAEVRRARAATHSVGEAARGWSRRRRLRRRATPRPAERFRPAPWLDLGVVRGARRASPSRSTQRGGSIQTWPAAGQQVSQTHGLVAAAALGQGHGAHPQPTDAPSPRVGRGAERWRSTANEQELATRRVFVDEAANDIPDLGYLLPFVDQQGVSPETARILGRLGSNSRLAFESSLLRRPLAAQRWWSCRRP